MKVRNFAHARAFLRRTRVTLEANEAANSLMLGICGQLIQHPERFKEEPCLKTVEDESGLVLAAVMTPPHKLVVSGRLTAGHPASLAAAIRLRHP